MVFESELFRLDSNLSSQKAKLSVVILLKWYLKVNYSG